MALLSLIMSACGSQCIAQQIGYYALLKRMDSRRNGAEGTTPAQACGLEDKTSDIPRHTGTACLRKIAKNLPAFLLHKINLGLRTKKQVCYALDLF